MTSEKKVIVQWDAKGLHAVPNEIEVDSRSEVLWWELKSSRRGARISRIEFADFAGGPFAKVDKVDAEQRLWQGEGSKNEPMGRRYKYSIFVSDGGAEVELDPFVIDTDKPYR